MQKRPSDDLASQIDFMPDVAAVSGSQQSSNSTTQAAPSDHPATFFYTQEEQEDDSDLRLPPADEQEDLATPPASFVLPFQSSAAMPTLTPTQGQEAAATMGSPSPPAPSVGKTHRSMWWQRKTQVLLGVALITLIGATFFVFAQSAPSASPPLRNATPAPGPSRGTLMPPSTSRTAVTPQTPEEKQTPASTPSRQQPPRQVKSTATSASLPSLQSLGQLGWTQAGLTLADAAEALRTGSTFTDREMSYDYRNIGTPTHHSGTLTAATFLLTSGGQARFAQNDKRAINNTLYDQIQAGKIVQQVVSPQPSLIQMRLVSLQGQTHQFAWVNVAFTLLQATSNPATGQRTEQIEHTTTGQTVLHHLAVILVRVAPQTQGGSAPMGGTGWLVDTYALDATTLPAIATTPSL